MDKKQDKKQDQILNEIRQNLKTAEEYWQDNYERGVEDKEFVTVEGAQCLWILEATMEELNAEKARQGK